MSINRNDVERYKERLILNFDENTQFVEANFGYRIIKRLFDFFVATLALILLSPVFLIIAILIKFENNGPVFFGHTRTGYKGEQIKIWKFRSMKENAEDLINDFTEEQKKEFFTNFKLDNDPRITKMGHFLRKTSIDELPQLINVLSGTMSLVGPRPVTDAEIMLYGERKHEFLSALPGITGYWQANGRSNVEYPERIDMELFYIHNQSFLLDIKIILKTVVVVAKRDGAK